MEVAQTPSFTKFEYIDTKCCICNANNEEVLYEIDKYKEGKLTFVKCKVCNLIYQNPRPTPETLSAFFNTSSFSSKKDTDEAEEVTGYYDYNAGEEFRRRMSIERLKMMNGLFNNRRPLDILKIAPGTGIFLKLAQDDGHNVTVVDISEYFVNYCKERYGIQMILSSFEEVDLGEKQYDLIAFFGAVFNVSDPKLVLEKIYYHLKPGGQLHINYNDADNWWVKYQKDNHFLFRPPVINFFNKQNFVILLEMIGFKVTIHQKEAQYTNMAKLAYFSKVKPLIAATEKFNLHNLVFKIPVPGAYYIVCEK